MRAALLVVLATLACGRVAENSSAEMDTATDASAPNDGAAATFDVADPEPDLRIPTCAPADPEAWKVSPFVATADPADCPSCGCTDPGALRMRVGDRDVVLASPLTECNDATGPLLRTYTYRGRYEFSVAACAEPRAGGECVFAWWAKNTHLALTSIEKHMPAYRDPTGEVWQLLDVDGCIAKVDGEKKPSEGRFTARAVAKDGRAMHMSATFTACRVFGFAVLGVYEPYELPDCP